MGQLNLNWDKRNVYEANIRIHLLVKGPDVTPGASFSIPATNVDLAPTILALAGVTDLSDAAIDGKSFANHIPGKKAISKYVHNDDNRPALNPPTNRSSAFDEPWRDHVFIEYYYVGLRSHCGMTPIELDDNNFIAVRHFADAGSEFGDFLYVEFQVRYFF